MCGKLLYESQIVLLYGDYDTYDLPPITSTPINAINSQLQAFGRSAGSLLLFFLQPTPTPSTPTPSSATPTTPKSFALVHPQPQPAAYPPLGTGPDLSQSYLAACGVAAAPTRAPPPPAWVKLCKMKGASSSSFHLWTSEPTKPQSKAVAGTDLAVAAAVTAAVAAASGLRPI